MSVTTRAKYHFRALRRAWLSWRPPAVLETTRAKVILSVSLLVLGGAYIVKTNELSTTGYHIHDLESKVASLSDDTQKLEVQIATMQSMPNINRRLSDLRMVQPVSVSYVNTQAVVAKK